jgi:hypothetical protein
MNKFSELDARILLGSGDSLLCIRFRPGSSMRNFFP